MAKMRSLRIENIDPSLKNDWNTRKSFTDTLSAIAQAEIVGDIYRPKDDASEHDVPASFGFIKFLDKDVDKAFRNLKKSPIEWPNGKISKKIEVYMTNWSKEIPSIKKRTVADLKNHFEGKPSDDELKEHLAHVETGEEA